MNRKPFIIAQVAALTLMASAVVSNANPKPDVPAAPISAQRISDPQANPFTPVGTAFSYVGLLEVTPNYYDLQFKLFDAPTGGSQIAGTVTVLNQHVTNDVYSV